MRCPTCLQPSKKEPQTWTVTCAKCDQDKWPYSVEKPQHFVCALCKSGSNAGKQASGKKGAAARAARRKEMEAP